MLRSLVVLTPKSSIKRTRVARPRSVATETSERMRRIRRRGTAPELRVLGVLSRLKVRPGRNATTLPGSPDFYSRSRRWAVFVHGCFWHGHDNCHLYRLPRTNILFWREKVDSNRRRDKQKARQLRAMGWRVAVIWQCQLANEEVVERKLRKLIQVTK
jgi:DNA mismatch endonuclease, patch repair protein